MKKVDKLGKGSQANITAEGLWKLTAFVAMALAELMMVVIVQLV